MHWRRCGHAINRVSLFHTGCRQLKVAGIVAPKKATRTTLEGLLNTAQQAAAAKIAALQQAELKKKADAAAASKRAAADKAAAAKKAEAQKAEVKANEVDAEDISQLCEQRQRRLGDL
mgnify:CR=1 FL=1